MRISSEQIFMRGLNNLFRQQIEFSRLQQQLISQRRVETASDDPIAAAKIELMNQRIMFGERLQKNRENAAGALQLEEGVLTNVENVIQRLRELQVQAGNGALGNDERNAIAIEAEGLLTQLQGLANSQDSSGSYIFSGSKTSTQTITRDSNGRFIYNGDQTIRYQAISSGLNIALNDVGSELFMRIPSGNGVFAVSEPAQPNTGTVVASAGTVLDSKAVVEDTYTLSFVLNSNNQMVLMVTGAKTGHVIPPSGLPDDAPLYSPGQAITFNGLQIEINGAPDAGDSLIIKPANSQSIFDTVQGMIDNLHRPLDSASDKARIQTMNNQLLSQLDLGLHRILDKRAALGGRMNQLDLAEAANQDLIDISTATRAQLAELSDTALAEVATSLELQKFYLEIAEKAFTKIQGLSVFNYI